MSSKFDWDWAKGYVDPEKFWNVDEIKNLPYKREAFNDSEQMKAWKSQGFTPREGELYDMRHADQPHTTQALISWAESRGLEHVGVSYYRMQPGDNLPYHADLYSKYISLFDLEHRKKDIFRYVFFVESKKPGHIIEVNGRAHDWISGDYLAWRYDVPHMAANLGNHDRYTIQLTGVVREG